MKTYMLIDCGATRCKVHILQSDGKFTTSEIAGFSPISQSWSEFPFVETDATIDELHFFGTAVEKNIWAKAHKVFKKRYPTASLHISHDLEAAALATMGEEKGYIHIIGTGSATGYWDGKEVLRDKLNLGYLFEDYASGYDIAKEVIMRWNEGRLQENELTNIEAKHCIKDLITSIYRAKNKKKHLAKYSFLINELNKNTKAEIFNSRIEHFFTKNIDNLAHSYPHHFVGTMAFLMRDIIKVKAAERGIKIGSIVADTDQGLVSYFKRKITNQNGK